MHWKPIIIHLSVICGVVINSQGKPHSLQTTYLQPSPTRLEQISAKFRVLEEPRADLLGYVTSKEHEGFNNGFNATGNSRNVFEQSEHGIHKSTEVNRIPLNDQYQSTQQSLNQDGAPRLTPNRKRRTGRPIPQGPPKRQDSLSTKQDGPSLVPSFSHASPIELSLGGLTGLQGLPPLSFLQFIKLLVAVTPFIIPLIFVPLLIFTLGMFMIPVTKTNLFLGGDLPRKSSSWLSSVGSNVVPSLTNFARNIANHEDCIERLTCEIGKRYIPQENESLRNEHKNSVFNISQSSSIVLRRILDHFDHHPLMQRISKSLKAPSTSCGLQRCSPVSFFQKLMQ